MRRLEFGVAVPRSSFHRRRRADEGVLLALLAQAEVDRAAAEVAAAAAAVDINEQDAVADIEDSAAADSKEEMVVPDVADEQEENEMKVAVAGRADKWATVCERLILNIFDTMQQFNHSQESTSHLLGVLRSIPLLSSLPRSYRRARSTLGDHILEPTRIDCCAAGCMLYYGESAGLQQCGTCGAARLDGRGRARKTFFYWPLGPRIVELFADPVMAEMLRHPTTWRHDPTTYRDVYDGVMWRDHFMRRFARDPRALAFSLCLDSIQVSDRTSYGVYPILLSLLNLPPSIRFLLSSQWLIGLIPGPTCANAGAFLGTVAFSFWTNFLP